MNLVCVGGEILSEYYENDEMEKKKELQFLKFMSYCDK